jgi:hypothetical protein
MKTRKVPISIFAIALSVIFAAVLLMTAVGRAADNNFFLRQQIDIPGTILDTRTGDINGDGKLDIVALSMEPTGARVMFTFLQREAGRFPPLPSQRVVLSPTVNLAECRDLNGDGKAEILVIDRDGLWAYSQSGTTITDKPTQVVAQPTVFVGGIDDCLLDQKIIYTVSGKQIAFVPVIGGFSLWEYGPDKFKPYGEINFAHRICRMDRSAKLFGANQGVGYDLVIPEIVIADENGDGRDDIYLLWCNRLMIFHQKASGGFDSDGKTVFQFQKPGDGSFCQARLVDYDHSGKLDLICSRAVGGIAGARTEIDFHSAERIAKGNKTENSHVTLTDVCGNLMVSDVDGKGTLELVVPAIELGIMSTVKKMISKETDFYLLIYPIDSLGQIDKEPAVRRKMTCQLDFEKSSPAGGIRLDWSGDFDGDGLADLLLADGGGQLMFFRGSKVEFVEGKAGLVLDLASPDTMHTVDLNHDGRSDMIIVHTPGEVTSRMTLLVTNRIS